MPIFGKKNHQAMEEGQNFLDRMTLPHRLLFTLLGLGDNNFQQKPFRFLYHVYYMCMICLLTVCLVWNVFLYLDEFGIKIFNMTMYDDIDNYVDMYAGLGRSVIFYYRQLVTVIFLACTVPSQKFSPLVSFWSKEKNFEFIEAALQKREDGKLLSKQERYLVLSYGILLLYLVNVISVDVCFFLLDADSSFGVINAVFSRFLPNIIITLVLAKACTTYICTYVIWDCYNHSFCHPVEPGSDQSITDQIKEQSSRYDSLTEFTELVSSHFRFYNTVHVASVAALVAVVYESIYASMGPVPKTMCWIFEFMHLSAFFYAAMVHASSSMTPRCLYKFYKKRVQQEKEIIKTDISLFDSFHHYVAHEWAPVSLDIAGVLSINFAMVGVLLFTAINWIGVIIQFRQGSTTGNSTTGGHNSCDDIMEFLKHGNHSSFA